MELKNNVVKGVAWNVAEKAGTMLFQFCVSVVLLNLLTPDDYGVIPLLGFFCAVASAIVEGGFSQALIRKREPAQSDFSSVFYFNAGMSLVLYLLLVALSWPLSRYYGVPELWEIAPVLFLIVPATALGIIQVTMLARRFDFKRLSQITVLSSFLSGVTAVGVAWAGGGVWSLVAQRVSVVAFRSMLLWLNGTWRPGGGFSFGAIRSMSGYSSQLLFTDIMNTALLNVPQMFIGKIYTQAQTGFFDQGQKLKELPTNSLMQAVQSVTFPALSELQNDPEKFTASVRKIVMVMTFIMFPVMAGMIGVAPDVFRALLKPQWAPTVPLFRVLCLAGFLTPVSLICYNVLKARCQGADIFRMELAKKTIAVALLALTIPVSVEAIAWGQVFIALSDFLFNTAFSARYSRYGLGRMVRDTAPAALLTALMAAAVWGVGTLLAQAGVWWRLAAEIGVGVAVYLVPARLLRLEAMEEVWQIVRGALPGGGK